MSRPHVLNKVAPCQDTYTRILERVEQPGEKDRTRIMTGIGLIVSVNCNSAELLEPGLLKILYRIRERDAARSFDVQIPSSLID